MHVRVAAAVDAVAVRLPSPALRRRRVATLVPIVFATVSFSCVLGVAWARNAWAMSAVLLAGLTLMTWALRRVVSCAPAARFSPTACAIGHCGACGYDMTRLTPEGEHIICPECGAAWHTDRRTHTDLPTDVQAAMMAYATRNSDEPAVGRSDDRGVRLLSGYAWPRGLLARTAFGRTVPPAAVRRFEMIRRRTRLCAYGVIALVWVVAAGAYARFGAATPKDVLGVGAVLAFFLALVAIACSFISIPADTVRRVILAEGCCPQCGYMFSNEREHFDGCRVCRRCRAAWKAVALGVVRRP